MYFPVPHKRADSFCTINSIRGTCEISHNPPTHLKLHVMGNWTVIAIAVQRERSLSRSTFRPSKRPEAEGPFWIVRSARLNLISDKTREDAVSKCERHVCFSPLFFFSSTVTVSLPLSLPLHLPNDMWVAVYFCPHFHCQDSALRRKRVRSHKSRKFIFNAKPYVTVRLMSGRVMAVKAKGRAE